MPLGGAAVDRLTAWAPEPFGIGPGTRVLSHAPLNFDLASAGTDNVRFCHSEQDLKEAFEAVTAGTDRYGGHNTTVLAQEYHLHGDEYFVNTVSRDGAHHLVEVWRYHKSPDGARPMYDFEEPVPPEDPAVATVVPYVLSVLDALEIRNGAAHTEVILTVRGPVLVESAARAGGSHAPAVVSRFLGADQLDCMARAIARPEDLAEHRLPRYWPSSRLRYVTLVNPYEAAVLSAEHLAELRSLDSFVDLVLTLSQDAPLPRTVDLFTSPTERHQHPMAQRKSSLDGLADYPADWTSHAKRIFPGESPYLPGACLKWYDIRGAHQDATLEITAEARDFQAAEAATERLEFRQELGFVLLHRDGATASCPTRRSPASYGPPRASRNSTPPPMSGAAGPATCSRSATTPPSRRTLTTCAPANWSSKFACRRHGSNRRPPHPLRPAAAGWSSSAWPPAIPMWWPTSSSPISWARWASMWSTWPRALPSRSPGRGCQSKRSVSSRTIWSRNGWKLTHAKSSPPMSRHVAAAVS
ncbi:hypothetical protein [Streptomyces malaysiensis]